eukprot:1137787-Pelagomonas_calceolata.AAC.2
MAATAPAPLLEPRDKPCWMYKNPEDGPSCPDWGTTTTPKVGTEAGTYGEFHGSSEPMGDTLAQRAVSLPHQRIRGKLVWVRWVFESMWPQGIRVTLSVFDFNGTSGRGHWQPERKLRAKAIHLMTFWEGAYKARGSFEAYHMFLVIEGACQAQWYWKIIRFIWVVIQLMFQKALLMPLLV